MRPMKLSRFAASGVLLGALGLAAPVSQADQEWQRAMNNGRSALLNGDAPDARRWFSVAERRTRSFGATDWRTAGTLNNRGALALANGDLDTAIHIRTAVIKDGEVHVQAGGGTVADARPDYEYRESLNKAKAMFKAVEIACENPMLLLECELLECTEERFW